MTVQDGGAVHRPDGGLEVRRVLERCVDEIRAFPGAVLAASHGDRYLFHYAVGRHTFADDSVTITEDSLFDLASVSKVFTSVAALRLVHVGQLATNTAIGDVLAGLPADVSSRTVLQLLTHTSGLPSVPELHKEYDTAESLMDAIRFIDVGPVSGAIEYSSLNHMYVCWMMEKVTGQPLSDIIQQHIAEPLELTSLTFSPDRLDLQRLVPTEYSIIRRRVIHGEIHDENAALLGRPSGHTGLFGTAGDVLKFCRHLLADDLADDALLESPVRELLFRAVARDGTSARTASFVVDDPQFADWGVRTFSHVGFTGTSVLLVPSLDVAVVLLSNRVFPTRRNNRIEEARLLVHTAIRSALGG